MTKTRTAILITLLTVALLAVMWLVCSTAPTVVADNQILTLDSVFEYDVSDDVETLGDVTFDPKFLKTRVAEGQQWTYHSMQELHAIYRYRASDSSVVTYDQAIANPGKYKVQVVLDEDAATYRSLSGDTLGPGSVVFAYDWFVLSDTSFIYFAPQNDARQGYAYADLLHSALVVSAGKALAKDVDYSLTVTKDKDTISSGTLSIGEYTITFALLKALDGHAIGEKFSTTLRIRAKDVLTLDATLYWYRDGANAIISPRLWTRLNEDSPWSIVTLDEVHASLKYIKQDGTPVTEQQATQDEGNYIAQIVLNEDADAFLAVDGQPFKDNIVFERKYRILADQLTVVFAPQNDFTVGDENYSYANILSKTQVLHKGEPLVRFLNEGEEGYDPEGPGDYTVTVEKDASPVTNVDAVGEYVVKVTLLKAYGSYAKDKVFTSVFNVKGNLEGLVLLDSNVRYEGMFNDLTSDEAISYYRPGISGTLASSYPGEYTVSYYSADGIKVNQPTQAGQYRVRLTIKENPSAALVEMGLGAGDYVDAFYSIKPTPFTVTFSTNTTEHVGSSKYDINYRNEGIRLNDPVINVIDSKGDVRPLEDLDFGAVIYYWDGSDWKARSKEVPDYMLITERGYYKVVFEVRGGELSGNSYFPGSDGFRINSKNNLLESYFEITSRYTVNGVRSSYVFTGEALGDALNPRPESNGSLADEDLFSVNYSLDGVPVDPQDVGLQSGHYKGVITFEEWTINEATVTPRGETYHFSFDVLPEHPSLNSEVLLARQNSKFVFDKATLKQKLGLVSDSELTITYLYNTGVFFDKVDEERFFENVGTYRVDITIKAGRYSGYHLWLEYINRAVSSLDKLVVTFDNADKNNVIPYTGMPVQADIDFGDIDENEINYSVYYQIEGQEGFCDYPIDPGSYRVRIHINQACGNSLNAKNGDERIVYFTIKPLALSVEFAVLDDDDIYDGEAKTYAATYYADKRPMSAEEIALMDTTVLCVKADAETELEDLTFVDYSDDNNKPKDAGDYYFAVIFGDDMQMFGLSEFVGGEYTYANLQGHGVFSDVVKIDKLQLAVIASLPHGDGGYYTGEQLQPSYTYYKYNGSSLSSVDKVKGLPKVELVTAGSYDTKYRRGDLGADAFGDKWLDPNANISQESEEKVGNPIDTGKYQYVISLKEADSANMYFAVAFLDYKDNSLDFELDQVGDKYPFGRPALAVVYPINPRPVVIRAKAYEGSIFYGQAGRITAEDLSWETVNASGETIVLDKEILKGFVSLDYYVSAGNSIATDDSLFDGNGLFAAGGNYTLRLTFREPATDEEGQLYSHYTLKNGFDAEDLPLTLYLQGDCYVDIRFRVRTAEELRVVFVPKFKSYAVDGNAKEFDVKFVTSGNETVDLVADTDYLVKYRSSSGNDVDAPKVAGDYSIFVEFQHNIYQYRIVQRQGHYDCDDSSIPYIINKGAVTYEFSVISTTILQWEWINPDGEVRPMSSNAGVDPDDPTDRSHKYYYDGTTKSYSIRFFFLANDETKTTVNLMLHTDYEINFYSRTIVNDGVSTSFKYTRLGQAPSEVGIYYAEIVFLTDLDDYRFQSSAGDAIKIVPYDIADQTEGHCFGKSLLANDLSTDMKGERRYIEFHIDKAQVLISGLSIIDKAFDNTFAASTNGNATASIQKDQAGKPKGVITSAAAKDFATIIADVNNASFDKVGVGEQSVTLGFKLGETVVPVPHVRLTADGVQFLQEQLESHHLSPSWTSALVRLAESYTFVWEDVKATIIKRDVSLVADDKSRTYDPYYVDEGELTFHFADADQRFLRDSLHLTSTNLFEYFNGSLIRADRENFNVNEEGYAITFSQDWAWKDDLKVDLADGTKANVSDLFNCRFSSAKYYILRKQITISTFDTISRYYDEDDVEIEAIVLKGKLLSGDRIIMDPNRNKHAGEDVGRYPIDFGGTTIYNGVSDRTGNYEITFLPAYYEILRRKIIIRPDIETDLERQNYTKLDYDNFAPQALVRMFNDYGTEVALDLGAIGARVEGNFTLTARTVTAPTLYASYAISSGQLRIVKIDGNRDITSNFDITPLTNCIFNVRKYLVRLSLSKTEYEKTYGSADPQMLPYIVSTSPAGLGLTVSDDSTVSRETGEDVRYDEYGSLAWYNILPTNEGTIRILNASGDDVTEYCYIEVENYKYENMETIYYKLTIKPLPVVVTILEETVHRSSRAIVPTIVFLDERHNPVSNSITSTMKARFGLADNQNFVEGKNVVTPVLLTETDPNFTFTMEPGILNIIYPENDISVTVVDVDDDLTENNRFAFVDGRLFKTLQLYETSTGNGQDPTEQVQALLPTTENTIGRKVFVIAVRKDGSYVMLDPVMTQEGLLIADTEFNYVMVCEVVYWPYIVAAAVVLLVIIAAIALIIHSKKRRKMRGNRPGKLQKAKSVKAPKTKAPKQAKEEGIKPVKPAKVKESKEPKVKEPKPVKEKEPKPVKVKESKPAKVKQPKGKDKAAEETPSMAEVQPLVSRPEDSLVVSRPEQVPAGDEEILVSSSSRFDQASSAGSSRVRENLPSDDEEIVVSTSRRRVDDEDQ